LEGKFHNHQLLTLLKKLESIAFSGTVHLNLESEEHLNRDEKNERRAEKSSNCILACRNGQLMYAVPCLPDIHSIIDFLEHKLQRQWIAPAVVFASRQLKNPHSTQELIERLISMELFTWGEIEAIFYAQTVIRLEQIWDCAGSFRVEKSLNLELRSAWEISDLLLEMARRKDRWTAIKPMVASMNLIPHLSSDFECANAECANVPASVKKHLTEWVDGKRSLDDIAQCLDKDPLQIAQSYAKWVKEKWVTFQKEELNIMPLVLAIDDSAVVQQIIQRTLCPFCRVTVASNAVDGLSILYHQPVKLLLLDVMMPEIDGLEVCRTIRRMPQFTNLPIIMLTGKDGFFDKMKGKMAGSTEYITKPFEAENLKQLVRQYLNLPKAVEQVEQRVERPHITGSSPTKRSAELDEMATRIQYQHS